jgi:hypothetical protein
VNKRYRLSPTSVVMDAAQIYHHDISLLLT